jgi:hypothetical protein
MTSFGAATAVILFTLLRRNNQLGKNFAVFIVGADLCVGPRCHVVHPAGADTQVCPYDG